MAVLAEFPVERVSSNGAVREWLIVAAHDPEEARKVASGEERDWTVVTCGAAFPSSPADYGEPRILEVVTRR